MKNKAIEIQIAEPCHEKWSEMTPTEQGKHCKSCDKILTDFSKMSDHELLNFFNKSQGNLCGRFRKGQLDRKIVPLPTPSFTRSYAASALLVSGLALSSVATAQNLTTPLVNGKISTHQTTPSEEWECNMPVISLDENEPQPITIKGTMTDNTGEIMIFCTVYIQGTDIGTQSDIDGHYSLTIPAEYSEQTITLASSYIGYHDVSHEIDLATYNNESVDMVFDVKEMMILGGICVMETPPLHKKIYWSTKKAISRAWWFSREKVENMMSNMNDKKIARKANQKIKQNRTTDIQEFAPAPSPIPAAQPTIIQSVFPNPANDYLTVTINLEAAQTIDFQLINLLGQVILTKKYITISGTNEYQMDLPNDLASGTYFLKTIDENGMEKTKQVLIQKID